MAHWNRRRFGKTLFAGASAFGAALQSQATLIVSVNRVENDDPVDMSAVSGFERVGDFPSTLTDPGHFWTKVRSAVRRSQDQLDLRIKKAEISPDRSVYHAYRLQAKCIEPRKHGWGFLSQNWEVWVQFLIRQVDEEGSGIKLIDVMMSVGERPDPRMPLQELRNYAPAHKLGKQLLNALESGMV